MTTHSSILAWKIPWMEKPGGLPSMGLQKLGHDWAISLQPKKKKCLSPIYQENLEFSSPHVHPKIHKQDLSEYFRFKGVNKPAPLPLSAIREGGGSKTDQIYLKKKNLAEVQPAWQEILACHWSRKEKVLDTEEREEVASHPYPEWQYKKLHFWQ